MIQRFVNSLRVEEPSAPPVAVVTPPPAVAATPAAASPTQSVPSLATLLQASLLKQGSLQYQSVQQTLSGGAGPWSFTVGTTQRKTLRRRDKKRDAFVITDTGRTPAGKVENSYWVDAKTLLPYRWMGRAPGGASMSLELVDGALRGERKGLSPLKFDQLVGDKPLLFPGAPLELALSTLPLGQGFTGSLEVLEPEGLASGRPFSTGSSRSPSRARSRGWAT
ncbi:hypothetical protein ACN28S_56365 [Cystobacter fuscus]